jgi:hypothetical protein
MKNTLFVIFVLMLALPVSAQTSDPSKEWMEQVKEVVTTSNAWAATNAVVPGGISEEMLNDEMWEDVLFGYPTHVDTASVHGDFVIVDGKNTYNLPDTTLVVALSDISVPFYIPPGVDVTGTEFLVPIYDGQGRIIKSYAPSGQGQDDMASAKKSIDESSADALKVANVEWVEEEKSFITTMNGKDYFYQLDSASGKWVTEDPDAPKAIKAGDRKKDPTFIFDENGDLVASNKRNGYKFGMGEYAGYQNNYYRHAMNGSPLGSAGAFGYPAGVYQHPMMGGWNNGLGMNRGFGFGGGISFGFGVGFGNSFGCAPIPMPVCGALLPASYYGGPNWFNGFNNAPINFGGVVNNYYNDGCGGCKSANPAAVSADVKSLPMANPGGTRSNVAELDFADIAPTKDLRAPSEGARVLNAGRKDAPVTASRNIEHINIGPSHSGRTAGTTTTAKEEEGFVASLPSMQMGPSHSTARGNTNGNNPPKDELPGVRGNNKPAGGRGGVGTSVEAPPVPVVRDGGRGSVEAPPARNNGSMRGGSSRPVSTATPVRGAGGRGSVEAPPARNNGSMRGGSSRPVSTATPVRGAGGRGSVGTMRSATPARSKR